MDFQGFLEPKAPKLISDSFKVSLDWLRNFMKTKLGWLFRTIIAGIAKLPPN
jgi:hypothetical protein